LITSPGILMEVVDRMKLTQDPLYTAGFRGDSPAGLREYAAKNLEANLHVDLGRGAQLLYIAASARYPERAADIANAVTDAFMEMERRQSNEPASDRARRYSTEVAELRTKVAAAQENLATFRQHKGITSVANANGEETADTETQALTDLEQRLLEAQNVRRSLESKSAGRQSAADESLASPIIQQLKTQLSEQQTKLAELSVTEGSKHPKVMELKSQIALTARQLDQELATLSDNRAADQGHEVTRSAGRGREAAARAGLGAIRVQARARWIRSNCVRVGQQ
jgi:succinoglycan biosynthesis transport protein ExoP